MKTRQEKEGKGTVGEREKSNNQRQTARQTGNKSTMKTMGRMAVDRPEAMSLSVKRQSPLANTSLHFH